MPAGKARKARREAARNQITNTHCSTCQRSRFENEPPFLGCPRCVEREYCSDSCLQTGWNFHQFNCSRWPLDLEEYIETRPEDDLAVARDRNTIFYLRVYKPWEVDVNKREGLTLHGPFWPLWSLDFGGLLQTIATENFEERSQFSTRESHPTVFARLLDPVGGLSTIETIFAPMVDECKDNMEFDIMIESNKEVVQAYESALKENKGGMRVYRVVAHEGTADKNKEDPDATMEQSLNIGGTFLNPAAAEQSLRAIRLEWKDEARSAELKLSRNKEKDLVLQMSGALPEGIRFKEARVEKCFIGLEESL